MIIRYPDDERGSWINKSVTWQIGVHSTMHRVSCTPSNDMWLLYAHLCLHIHCPADNIVLCVFMYDCALMCASITCGWVSSIILWSNHHSGTNILSECTFKSNAHYRARIILIDSNASRCKVYTYSCTDNMSWGRTKFKYGQKWQH